LPHPQAQSEGQNGPDPTLLALFALQQRQLLEVYRHEHAQYLIWRKSIRLFRVNKTVGDFRADKAK